MSSKITAPRGTQDLVPPASTRWQELEARIHALTRRYGYSEIRTPVFEATELFVRGVGEDTDIVEKEMYTFTDKGGRSITLRPEWTAPVVRAVMQHNLLADGARRLYYIGPIFRYERPQAGRLRQAHQFGIELFGYEAPEADAEAMALGSELIESAELRDVTLYVNTIGDETCRPSYREALLAHFRPHAARLSEDSRRRLERNPLRVLDSKAPEDQSLLASAPRFEDMLCEACRAHFTGVLRSLDAMNVQYIVNPRIVRGLDYYTRTVFEFVSSSLGAQSTLCAGGRYDGLVHALGGPQTPAVGFALGIERFVMAMESQVQAAEPARTGVQAIALGAQARARLAPLAAQLRKENGFPVFMEYGDRKLLAQLKTADRNAARYALIVGSEELSADEAVLRDLRTRTDRRVSLRGADLAAALVEEES